MAHDVGLDLVAGAAAWVTRRDARQQRRTIAGGGGRPARTGDAHDPLFDAPPVLFAHRQVGQRPVISTTKFATRGDTSDLF